MTKKVFISYSWGNSEHQEWVVDLATRLMNDSIDVALDRWSLKDGHDIFSFMEEMVKAEDIFRVLVLSNKKYTEKADSREGGVGTETQIITPNIYANEKQEKFIPLVLERNENGEPFLPIYLKNRKYIDFSKQETYEDSYEELLRNILEAPSLPKPKLGSQPPTYITESVINLSETNSRLRTIENQLLKTSSIPYKDLNLFSDMFLDNLWNYEQKKTSNDLREYGDELYNCLVSYKPLREDFIKFVDLLTAHDLENTEDLLIDLFEKSSAYNSPRDPKRQGWNSINFDIFQIVFHELFIYSIAICLKNKNYKVAADLLHSKYYKKEKYTNRNEPEDCTFLYIYHKNLENYSTTFFNKTTGFGDYIITNISTSINKEFIILADTLCYFICFLNLSSSSKKWFPLTHLYNDTIDINFFKKTTSEKHFQKTKVLYNVDTKEELQEKLKVSEINSRDRIRYGKGFHEIPFIHELVNPETISIYR